MSTDQPERDPFWQQQIDLHIASRGRHADPSACGTCRERTAEGETVEHDGCAQRSLLFDAPDMPDYEVLIEMTEQEKADLPARFHIPRFDDVGKPNAWLCAVCWGEGWVTGWPCATAMKHGTQVFTPQHEAERARKREAAEVADLRAKLAVRNRQVDRLSNELADMETGLGLNEEAATA